ncbi:hypothetical protein Scep_018565 [Stephania cephalantha]|uniref:Uncharacterized protein n=1 Tax=Stephania cephalantha TaxID=152367 RepID=A0AAP0IA41_9MAGN
MTGLSVTDSSETPPTVNELYLHLHIVNHDGMTFIDTRSERFYKAKYAILLSGTLALSRPIELFKQLQRSLWTFLKGGYGINQAKNPILRYIYIYIYIYL